MQAELASLHAVAKCRVIDRPISRIQCQPFGLAAGTVVQPPKPSSGASVDYVILSRRNRAEVSKATGRVGIDVGRKPRKRRQFQAENPEHADRLVIEFEAALDHVIANLDTDVQFQQTESGWAIG